MKVLSQALLMAAGVVLLPLATQAQTAKPAAKPAVKTAAKPVAKPAPKPAAKPAAAPAAKPAPAPEPAPAAPQPQPAASASQTAATSSAVDGPFGIGTNVVNIGLGLGNRYGYGTGFGGSVSVSPALSVSYERGLRELGPGVLGIGVLVGYQGASYNFGGGEKFKYNDLIVSVRGAFHYPVLKELDAYAGIGVGIRHLNSTYQGSSIYYGSSNVTDVQANVFLGGRYFFNPNFGGFAELGYDQTYLKVGVTAKF